MDACSPDGDNKLFRNLSIGFTGGDQSQDLDFSFSQAVGIGWPSGGLGLGLILQGETALQGRLHLHVLEL